MTQISTWERTKGKQKIIGVTEKTTVLIVKKLQKGEDQVDPKNQSSNLQKLSKRNHNQRVANCWS